MMIVCTSIFASLAVGCGTFDQLICEHEYGAVVPIEFSTCTKKGKGEKTCKHCEKVETVELDYEKHTPVTVAKVEATCTEAGRTDYTVCYVCEKVLAPSAVISPLGHTVVKDKAVAATCLENGLTEGEHCGRCGEVFVAQKEIEATGHVVVEVEAKAATCTEAGYTAGQKCENCDQGYAGCEKIPETGHNFNGGNKCVYCGQGTTLQLSDLGVGVDISDFKLVLTATEAEIRDCLKVLKQNGSGGGLYDIYGGLEDEHILISISFDFLDDGSYFSLNVMDNRQTALNVTPGNFDFNEIVFNEDLGFDYSVYTTTEINDEMGVLVSSYILPLFELVYVGE